MTTKQAYQYVIDEARKMGYSEQQIKSFSLEVYDRLNMMEDTSKPELDKLLDEIF